MIADLLPCPFCGYAAEVRQLMYGHKVICTNRKCPAKGGRVEKRSFNEAIEAWNTRAAMQEMTTARDASPAEEGGVPSNQRLDMEVPSPSHKTCEIPVLLPSSDASALETIARAICVADGMPPDLGAERNGRVTLNWEEFVPHAKSAVVAAREVMRQLHKDGKCGRNGHECLVCRGQNIAELLEAARLRDLHDILDALYSCAADAACKTADKDELQELIERAQVEAKRLGCKHQPYVAENGEWHCVLCGAACQEGQPKRGIEKCPTCWGHKNCLTMEDNKFVGLRPCPACSERSPVREIVAPIPMVIHCPDPRCQKQHIDKGEWATRPHKTHRCEYCGQEWQFALVPTVGVKSLTRIEGGS